MLSDPNHITHGIRWSAITYNSDSHEGIAKGDFLAEIPILEELLNPGKHLIFFAGPTIIAVGTIIPSAGLGEEALCIKE
ncbi:hypothetical protein [Herpetosiphon geysericola]|nr:hypothetical protein [Herpetosiphon geysericola]